MSDPKDQTASVAQGALQPYRDGDIGTLGFGFGEPQYRMTKKYPVHGGSGIIARRITRPVDFTVLRNGVPPVLGTGANQITIVNGLVTFAPELQLLVSNIVVGATTQVTLISPIGLIAGDRLWLEDMTGADAATLNAKSHEILSVSTNVYTLAVDTTGLTINASGNGKKFPQASEPLTWSGSFYVPVHFANDELSWMLERGGDPDERLVSGQSIVLREVRE